MPAAIRSSGSPGSRKVRWIRPALPRCGRFVTAFKNFFYAVAHSNIMNGVPAGAAYVYSMSPWAIGLLVANIVVYAFILGMTVYLVIRFVREKRKPTVE